MLNPGYRSMVQKEEMRVDSGPAFRCPKCKKIIIEAVVERFKTRCKHCGKWIFIFKKNTV